MRLGLLKQAALGIALAATVAAAASCGSGSEPLPGNPAPLDKALPLEAADAPAEVSPELWKQLSEELVRVLAEEGTAKRVSAAPSGPGSVIPAPSYYDNPDDALVQYVRWPYRNMGDYDQNGEVNVSDLTPIGIHFGKTSTDSDWINAQLADGDGNGEVNIADVTPLGQNFGGQVTGFELQSSDNEGAVWQPVAEYSFSELSNPASGYRYINEPLLLALAWHRVVPFVGDGGQREYGPPGDIRYINFASQGATQSYRCNPERNGRSGGVGPETNNKLWELTLDGFLYENNAVANANGLIFIASTFEDEEAQANFSYIHGVSTEGELLWRHTCAGSIHQSGIVVEGDRVVFATNEGLVLCFEQDGRLAWTTQLDAYLGDYAPLRMHDLNLYFAGGKLDAQAGTVISLDYKGELRWQVLLPGPLSTGLIGTTLGTEIMAIHSGGTGATLFDFHGNSNPVTAPGEFLRNQSFHHSGSIISCLDETGDMLIYSMPGDDKFPFQTTGSVNGSPSVNIDGGLSQIIVGSGESQVNKGYISAWTMTGIFMWSEEFPEPVQSDILVDDSQNIYFTTWEHIPEGEHGIYSLDPDGDLRWFSDQSGLRCRAPVIIQNNMLLVTAQSEDSNKLMAFGEIAD